MNIVLNEREYAEAAINSCTLDNKPLDTLSRVARYYASMGYKRSDICSLLEEFMIKCDPTINIVKWQDTIDRQARDAMKYGLIEIEYIPITQNEIDICKSLSGKQMQRLMFTLICLSKFANAVNIHNNNWVNKKDKEIFNMANITTSVKRQSLMLNDLREIGLIRFSRKVDNVNINVECLDYNSEPVMKITDFRNIGFQFMKYCGDPYMECSSCGIVIRRGCNAQKYCPDCMKEINRQRAAENWRNEYLN